MRDRHHLIADLDAPAVALRRAARPAPSHRLRAPAPPRSAIGLSTRDHQEWIADLDALPAAPPSRGPGSRGIAHALRALTPPRSAIGPSKSEHQDWIADPPAPAAGLDRPDPPRTSPAADQADPGGVACS